MGKFLLSFLILISGCASGQFSNQAFATSLIIPYNNKNTGDTIYASQWNSNMNAITTWANNQNIDGTTNIAAGGVGTTNLSNLSVTDAKIYGITTAGKVNGSAITGINNLPAGAGVVPTANLGSGSATTATFLRGDGSWNNPFLNYVKISNTQSSGTNGGTATSGSWGTCILNTKDSDPGSIGSLSSNQLTLPAGTYIVHAKQVFFQTVLSQIRLQNITAGSTLLTGESQASGAADNTTIPVELNGEIILGSSSALSLQYQVGSTKANVGLGTACSFGPEVYATVEFQKIS